MSEEASNDKDSKTCGLCDDKPSKYCCPRCDVYYCSLDCYKSEKHQECSESFYKECVTETLVSSYADDESQRKMIDILKRMQEQDVRTEEDEELFHLDSDDDEDTDLVERIKELDLNDPNALWGVLTEDERNGFEALLNDEHIGSIIPQWEPWWMYKKSLKKVEEVGKEEETEMLKKCPELKKVPGLASLTGVKPSKVISFNITNVLASYAFVMRYFNGDVEPREWVPYFFNICGNLDTNTNFEDLEIAVESVAQKCLQSDLIDTDKHSLDIMKNDTYSILQGSSTENRLYYCKAALSELHKILHDAKTQSKAKPDEEKENKSPEKVFSKKFPDHGIQHLPKVDGDKLKKSMKKVEYYLSFLESYCMEF